MTLVDLLSLTVGPRLIGGTLVTLDPLISLTLGLGLAWLFAMALYHKIRDTRRFRETLREYGLIARSMIEPAAAMIMVLEMAVVVGWLIPATRHVALYLAAALLAGYAGAMSINLVRGRTFTDCGCLSAASAQPLSWWMVARNVALVAVALAALLPVGPREMSPADVMVAIMTVVMCAVLYELHANVAALNAYIKRGRA